MIQLRALGTLALRNPAGEDLRSVLAQPKRVALLVYLAIARPRGFHRRDTLLALLWPEQDEQHARWALNQALRHLRNALGREVLPSRGDEEVGLDFGLLTCDVVDFEAALEADDPAQALGLYQGDLLEGFHVSGCGDFERWLEEERVWLRRRAARAAALLAGREEGRGECVAAGHWARRAFALASDDESEIRSLIAVLDRLGDRAGAIEAYETFARRLREEYEAEPAPETRAVISAVRARQGTEVVPPHPTHQLHNEPVAAQPPAASAAPPQVQPRRRGRQTVLLGTALLALLLVGSMNSGPRAPPSVAREATLSRNTIAVLPFGYRGSSEYAYLGEGLVDLLSTNLDGAGEIRTVPPKTVITLMRQVGDDASEPGQARELVARLSAGSFVVGDVVEAGGRLRISARLYAVSQRNQLPLSAAVQGGPAQLFQLVDGLTAQLIAQQNGSPAAALSRVAALTTDSLSALKAYLVGERHLRAGELDSGLPALERAVRIDSSFALAHYRLATGLMWNAGIPQATEAIDRALRHGQRLTSRDRLLVEAFAASLRGRIPEAERIYREIVTRHPDDLEASHQLGDLIFHRHGILGRSWLDAREPFERVLSIDPTHQAALYHLSNIAARERRLKELDALTERNLQILPPTHSWFFRGQRAVAFGDTAETARFITALRKRSDEFAQGEAGLVVFATGDLVVGGRLWRMLAEPSRKRDVRVLAYLTLAKMELMRGRWSAAKTEIDSAEALDAAAALEHRVLLSLWPLLRVSHPELLALRKSLLQWKPVVGPSKEGSLVIAHDAIHPHLRLYLLGLLGARLGDYTPTLEYAAALERRADASFAPAFVRDLGRTLRAEIARARGRPEEALTILDSAAFWAGGEDVNLSGSSPFYEHEYELFVRAELLYALRRYPEALQWYRGIAEKLFHSGAPAHLRMAEIYDRQGEREKAASHYAKFVELWKDCDPELRSTVDEARRRISD